MGILEIRKLKNEPAKKPTKKRLRQRSKKGQITMRELATLYPAYLTSHPICNIKSPVCTHQATCVNHTQGRGPNEVLDQSTWEPSCGLCNDYIESHHAWARERGHKKSRHSIL